MQLRGPPRKVNICPHIPGIDAAASGIASHLSGLLIKGLCINKRNPLENLDKTHLNSKEFSPHIDFALLRARIGIINVWPFLILQGGK